MVQQRGQRPGGGETGDWVTREAETEWLETRHLDFGPPDLGGADWTNFGSGEPNEETRRDAWTNRSVTPGVGGGGHAGRGPKGYTRSDDRIQELLCRRLSADGRLDCRDVEIQVERGEVTLKGTIESRADKGRIEDIAAGLLGVKEVHNHMRVRQASTGG